MVFASVARPAAAFDCWDPSLPDDLPPSEIPSRRCRVVELDD
jgi:hypothetical protein